MGGDDHQPDIQHLDATPDEIAQFKLTSAQQGNYMADALNGAYSADGHWRSDSYAMYGEDQISDVVNQFNEWKKKNKATTEQHDEYVKLAEDRPGRAATVTDKSILGDMPKNILGG